MGSPQQNAGGTSIAAAGLQAYSSVLASEGTKAAFDYKAASLENAAQRGKVAAVQTGAKETIGLDNTLGMIDSVRAAAHDDPTSPTGAAIRDWNEQLGLSKKAIDVDNILAQSRQEMDDAAYLRAAGKTALLGGEISAGAGLLNSISKAMLPIPGGG